MADRATIARAAAAGLRKFAESGAMPEVPAMIGFDGFVDSIIHVVDKRADADHYQPISTIEAFGQRVAQASGQSSNFELVTTLKKLGGNGPIMANAMAAAGVNVTYVGALGYPAIDPVFDDFAAVAEVHTVANPGYTDALEFNDGKLMLGKYTSISRLGWDEVERALGEALFTEIVTRSRLIGMVNWTMLAHIESVWAKIAEALDEKAATGERTFVFIDLADPEKRTDADLRKALKWITKLNERADVILGMNLKESSQVAAAMGVTIEGERESSIELTARGIREAMNIYSVLVHPRRSAAAAVLTPEGVVSATFHGPFVNNPKLSTGAGDNFNAGFCLGRLAGLPVEQCLCVGTATSGYYVRHGVSPTLDQLAVFCDALPSPEQ